MGPPPPPGHVLTPPQFSTPPADLPAPGSQGDDSQDAGSAMARRLCGLVLPLRGSGGRKRKRPWLQPCMRREEAVCD
ncbi:hypothetical protein PVAP13_J683430 [Panicum virgatum]|nr:hypothetical protein PVAP13_J683463 [Panicum virgatum]KAG2481134.1 hypothetical protein PVAP13_J683453 [Panicum virgatum]KAG2481271.1 hypothetical protein PVAP13_J683430 [Panicum virgatum]